MATENVTINIDANNRASRALRSLKTDLRSITTRIRNLAGAAAAVGAAFAGAVTALGRLAEQGTSVINVQDAFATKVVDTNDALQLLRDSTRGLVSDMDLMTQMNQAMALGAAENEEQFAELAETALTLGRALGVDATRALESLSLGIGRQSRLILDNLGLTVSVSQANERYAESLGVAAEELTEAERREAFRTEALRQARDMIDEVGGVSLSTGDAFTQLVTRLRNVRDQVAVTVARSSELADFFNTIREAAPQMATAMVNAIGSITQRLLDVIEFFRSSPLVGQFGLVGLVFLGPAGGAGLAALGGLLDSMIEDFVGATSVRGQLEQNIANARRQIERIRNELETGRASGFTGSMMEELRAELEEQQRILVMNATTLGRLGDEGQTAFDKLIAGAREFASSLQTFEFSGGAPAGDTGGTGEEGPEISADVVRRTFGGLTDRIPDILTPELAAALSESAGRAVRQFDSRMRSTMANSGAQLVMGLLTGMRDAADLIQNFIINILSALVQRSFLIAFGIASPSKMTRGFGRELGRGLVLGMEDTVDMVRGAASMLSGAAASGFGSPDFAGLGNLAAAGASGGIAAPIQINLPRARSSSEQAFNDDVLQAVRSLSHSGIRVVEQ